jgi:ribosomal protein S18 acetylase RimI-like enzyme
MSLIRKAVTKDIPFLAQAIIAAEKGNSDKLSYSTLFSLDEQKVRELLVRMLEEENDGCELSLSSFLVAEADGRPVAAVAGWVEGELEDLPSPALKSNLILYTFPREAITALSMRQEQLRGFQMEREKGALQIEYVYVDAGYRGRGLSGALIGRHVEAARERVPQLGKMQVQVFENNGPALGAYLATGFGIAQRFTSKVPGIEAFYPGKVKLLLEKNL